MSWNQNQMMESFLVCEKPPVEYTLGVCLPHSVKDFTRLIQQRSAAQEICLCMDNNAKKSILRQSWGMQNSNLQRNPIFVLPKRSFKITSQLGWQWAHVLRACVLFKNKFNFGLHKFKNKLVFCHPRIIYKISSLSSASWNSLYTPKPTWYTFVKCSSDSSHQLQKKNSHIPDICCPQMVGKSI